MPKLPVLSANKVVKALKRAGFKIVRQSGSHIHLWHNERRILVTVPNHKELAKGTLNAIIKQSKWTEKSFYLLFVKCASILYINHRLLLRAGRGAQTYPGPADCRNFEPTLLEIRARGENLLSSERAKG